MKNLQQISLLCLSSLASICLFCTCWALLLDGALSRQVTNLLDFLREVLKDEVMLHLDQNQMWLVNTVTTVVKVVAVASSIFSCFNLLALASISIKHRLAQRLILPHLLTGCLSAINLFLLPYAILLFQPLPLPLDFPSVTAFLALLIFLFRLLLQELYTLTSLGRKVEKRKVSGLYAWRNIVPDIESDRVFLVSQPVEK